MFDIQTCVSGVCLVICGLMTKVVIDHRGELDDLHKQQDTLMRELFDPNATTVREFHQEQHLLRGGQRCNSLPSPRQAQKTISARVKQHQERFLDDEDDDDDGYEVSRPAPFVYDDSKFFVTTKRSK